jgi:protein-disulfide isomerase/uncharacterized membrane protein
MGRAANNKRSRAPAHVPLPAAPRWAVPLLTFAAAAGALLAGVSTWVHHRVTSSHGTYTSFCSVSDTVNCDTVVTSSYGTLLGVPVSVWGLAFYAVLLVVARRAASADEETAGRARADAFALAVFGAFFSLYLLAVSAIVLKTLCLLCLGLYVVAALSLLAGWRLASPIRRSVELLRERWRALRRRPALATAGAIVVTAIVLVPTWLGAPTRMTRQEVLKSNPAFYDWYTGLPIVEVPTGGGIAQGPKDAPIQLVEFSDFECPHCSRAYATLKDLLPRYSKEVRFVYHHFPISNKCNPSVHIDGHENACAAAIAAECAAKQGKFSAYATQLFANQESLSADDLKQYAQKVSLDLDQFQACLRSPQVAERVRHDAEMGKEVGLRQTPTFFLNGRRIEGNLSFEDWMMALAIELDKS